MTNDDENHALSQTAAKFKIKNRKPVIFLLNIELSRARKQKRKTVKNESRECSGKSLASESQNSLFSFLTQDTYSFHPSLFPSLPAPTPQGRAGFTQEHPI